MKVVILVYDTCAQFEVTLAALFLKEKHELVTAGLQIRDFEGLEGFRLRPHVLLSELDPEKVDLFILPGGMPEKIHGDPVLTDFLQRLHAKGKTIATICGGPTHLGHAGLLKGRRFTTSVFKEWGQDFIGGQYTGKDIEEDGNIITAMPNAYVDFGLRLAQIMNVFLDEEDYQETVRIFREFKQE